MLGKKTSLFTAIIFFALILFFAKSVISLDPDFGFRFKTGELILASGFPKTDPYSYTMPSFPYVEHAWIIAVVWAKLYPVIGYTGLSVAFSLLAVFTLVIAWSRAKRTKTIGSYQQFIFVLAVAVFLPFVGVRAQVVTWLFTAILLKVFFDKELWQKWRGKLPLLFIFWANLHGGFAAGLLILFFVVATKALQEKRFGLIEVYILTASTFATLINPYGIGAWREVWSSLSDTALRWQISEWMPVLLSVDLSFAAFFTLSITLVVKHRKKFALEEIGLFFLVLLQGMLSRRHVPLWVIVALPMTSRAIGYFFEEIKTKRYAVPRFKVSLKYAYVGSLAVLLLQMVFVLSGSMSLGETRFYPKEAVLYLSKNLPEREIFSKYGWGGYLIWNLPEKKVFIDGRMPSWRRENNPQKESADAFDDYNLLLEGKLDYKVVFDKYGIETVLWPRPVPKSVLQVWVDTIESFFAREEKADFDFLNTIERDGWEKTYEDSVAVIFRKPY